MMQDLICSIVDQTAVTFLGAPSRLFEVSRDQFFGDWFSELSCKGIEKLHVSISI